MTTKHRDPTLQLDDRIWCFHQHSSLRPTLNRVRFMALKWLTAQPGWWRELIVQEELPWLAWNSGTSIVSRCWTLDVETWDELSPPFSLPPDQDLESVADSEYLGQEATYQQHPDSTSVCWHPIRMDISFEGLWVCGEHQSHCVVCHTSM